MVICESYMIEFNAITDMKKNNNDKRRISTHLRASILTLIVKNRKPVLSKVSW